MSVGLAPTKTLAKLANRGSKASPVLGGVCHFGAYDSDQQTAIIRTVKKGEVWGIDSRTAKKLAGMGIHDAADLRDADVARIRCRFGVVQARVVQDLRGIDCLPLEELQTSRDTIQHSRSFATPISTVAEPSVHRAGRLDPARRWRRVLTRSACCDCNVWGPLIGQVCGRGLRESSVRASIPVSVRSAIHSGCPSEGSA